MISFIVPARNEERAIEDTLKSLSAYTGPHEIIVSDGASSDRTIEVAKRYTSKVVEHTSPVRQTISGGRNAGAAVATGDFLVFVDADVVIKNPDQFFAKALSLFEQDPKLVALAPCIRVFPEHATFFDNLIFGFMNYYCRLFNNVFGIGGAAGEFQMFPTEIFRKLGGYNEKYVAGEDYELFRRLSHVGHTRLEGSLTIYHTGRRAHKVGWPRLLTTWALNSLWVMFFSRSYSKEWTNVR